jgi:hypothetical protein
LKRIGTAELGLHFGRAPSWLTSKMINLAREILAILVNDLGKDEALRRLADPFWFQALANTLAYDWDSSGTTTVVCGVLKNALIKEELGIAVAGGKGRTSRRTPEELLKIGEQFSFSTSKIESLRYSSRMTAKVDSTAIQDGYRLYHHTFIVSDNGKWAVIQQGMNTNTKMARRYHWLSDCTDKFLVEPHEGIVGSKAENQVLDMTANSSEECRKTSTDLVNDNPKRLQRIFKSCRVKGQSPLTPWIPDLKEEKEIVMDVYASRPNWKALERAYEIHPMDYEEFLSIRGIGPATVRGLAIISDLVYGSEPSWKDPVKYTFAFGGKDGIPFPVNRNAMDEAIEILETAVDQSRLGEEDKLRTIHRLRRLANRTHHPTG